MPDHLADRAGRGSCYGVNSPRYGTAVARLTWMLGSWNELWISEFSPFRFESIAPAPRNVGVKGRHFGGTTGTRHRTQRRMSLVWESYGATRSRSSLHTEAPTEPLHERPDQSEARQATVGVLQIEADPLVLHTELVESRAPAQADGDGDLPMLVAAMFCRIHQQFIDDQRQRHGCLFGKIPPGRFATDRYVAAEQSSGVGADSVDTVLPVP